MTVSTQAPCRVDLAGGTLDIWPLYLHHANAVTVNFAIDVYTRCRVSEREGRGISLRSIDQGIEEHFESLDALKSAQHFRHPLAAWVVKHFSPAAGLQVETDSESPSGAGIAGSSSLLIATVSAFNRLLKRGYSIEDVRVVAQNIEAQIIRVPTGCQDYYPAMYGGLSAISLGVSGIQRRAIPVDNAELNRRIVLAYTGKPRNSGINNWEVTKHHIDGNRKVHRNFDRIASIADSMKKALERNDFDDAARLLQEEWNHRRRNAPGITTPLIDHLARAARRNGARASKVCGAGGGGCVVFLCEPDARSRVIDALRRENARVLDVSVAPRGVRYSQSRPPNG